MTIAAIYMITFLLCPQHNDLLLLLLSQLSAVVCPFNSPSEDIRVLVEVVLCQHWRLPTVTADLGGGGSGEERRKEGILCEDGFVGEQLAVVACADDHIAKLTQQFERVIECR